MAIHYSRCDFFYLLLLFLFVVFLILTIAILNYPYLFCGSESACKSNACGKLNSIGRGFSLLTLVQSWSWCPSWIVTLGQESRGLQIGGWINCWHIPRPNRTLTYPHTHTDTDKYTVPPPHPPLYHGPDTHFDTCLAANKKISEQNQLAITAVNTGLSPPGNRVLEIKDRANTTPL